MIFSLHRKGNPDDLDAPPRGRACRPQLFPQPVDNPEMLGCPLWITLLMNSQLEEKSVDTGQYGVSQKNVYGVSPGPLPLILKKGLFHKGKPIHFSHAPGRVPRQKGQTVTHRIGKTSAPRSTVVHMINAGETRNYSHETACGLRIGDTWAGEYDEEPTGDVTCKRCLPAVDIARLNARVAAKTPDPAPVAHPGAVFAIGERVGIVTGVLSVSGPWVYAYGTVTAHVEYWTGVVEYVIATDDGAEDGVYRGYLLRSHRCVCSDSDGFGHTCAAYPAGTPVGDIPAETDEEWCARIDTEYGDELAQEFHDHMRARSIAAHPAGKARPDRISDVFPGYPNAIRPYSVGESRPWALARDGRTIH